MSSKVFIYIRLALGILCVVFGINKFTNFLPLTKLTGEAANYFTALSSSKAMALVGITLIVIGLALIFDKYSALATLILMSISVNAFLFHIVLNPSGIVRTATLLILNSLVLFSYRDKYKTLL
ncbi:hypothetical protein FBALC1_13597 [Flavobacteriales bacterium ALC-1]|nr:hypothetical protein FBALC1_13597 [Flavobacteriales bacterium ALC-1]